MLLKLHKRKGQEKGGWMNLGFQLILSLLVISCSQPISEDRVQFPLHAVGAVSTEMTKNIKTYPGVMVVPTGKPLFDAIGNALEGNGIHVERYPLRTFGSFKKQELQNFIKIRAREHAENEAVVILDSPYFTVSQIFQVLDGVPVSSQSLYLKPL